ncbi:MAG: CHC2 zinc finger domain-containing protein [Verrucomicrobiota bacterium]
MRFDSLMIQAMKERLPLPDLMAFLGAGEHTENPTWCPFHENKKTRAFSVYQTDKGWKWKCHSQCGSGDEIDFIERLDKCSRAEALERYSQLSGVSGGSYRAPARAPKASVISAPRPELKLPDDLHQGDRGELQTVATLRKVSFWSVATMQQNCVLRFGTVCGSACWIVTDTSGLIAEARRMDGRLFPAFDGGSERKAHTLKGSSKAWPVGLMLPDKLHESFHKVLLCEGSGDLVAAYHFAHEGGEEGQSWLPVAMLGASNRIHPEAYPLFRGKRVKLPHHVDPNEAGQKAAEKWAEDLDRIGCDVSTFNLEGLRRSDGSPIKDLNDCTDIHPGDAAELEGLLK